MKWQMKLRTRLFLSISALVTVALLGLMLGLVSVLQMATVQQQLVRDTTHALEVGLKLRQNLGEQLTLILDENTAPQNLRLLQDNFQALLDQGLEQGGERTGFSKASSNYQTFLRAYRDSPAPARSMGSDEPLGAAFNQLRTDLIDSHKQALEHITRSEERTRDRALLVSGVLGLMGLAILVLGFVTAHNIARRFGQPIEALAKAADQLGKGNFDVTLPVTQASELNQLTRRFGLMADALRKHQRLQAVLDSIDDGLLILDRQGRLEHLNPVAQRQLGWNDSRLGSTLAEALQRPELEQQLRQVLRGGSLDRPPDDLNIDVDEETRLLTYSLTPVSHPQGPILGAVMVLHDVTEQRAFERVRSEFACCVSGSSSHPRRASTTCSKPSAKKCSA